MSSDRYEIKKKIGEGGAGSVYLARDTRLDREVAIKRLMSEESGDWNQDTVDNMLKEARLLSTLEHPNIVTIYDADVDDDGPYVVMELLQGSDMDELIQEKIMTAKDFRYFAVQCLEAMAAAHSRNIIHRDIKPNNIVLKWLPNGRFQAKLLDFGMAKFSEVPSKQTVDHGDSVMGSIYFMAPEQFERIELDGRTDIYALGAVFYYCLTGVYPFTGETAAEVMAAHLTHRVQPLSELRPDLPEWACNWVMWLINRDMGDRPESAQSALDLFQANDDEVPLKSNVTPGAEETAAVQKQPDELEVAKPVLVNTSGQLAAKTTTKQTPKKITAVVSNKPLKITAVVRPSTTPSPQSTTQSVASTNTSRTLVRPPSTTAAAPTGTAASSDIQQMQTHPGEPQQQVAPAGYTGTQAHQPGVAQNTIPINQPAQKKLNLIPLLIILALAVPIIIIALLMKAGKVDDTKKYNTLINQPVTTSGKIPTSEEDVDFLVTQLYGVNSEINTSDVVERLRRSESNGNFDLVGKVIAAATDPAPSMNNEVRKKIFNNIISESEYPGITEKLKDFIKTHDHENTVIDAMNSTKKSLNSDDFQYFLSVIVETSSTPKRQTAAKLAQHIIETQDNNATFGIDLRNALSQASNPTVTATITRLIGAVGGTEQQNILISALNSGDKSQVIPALSALQLWPNADITEKVISFWSASADAGARSHALSAVISLLKEHHASNLPADTEMWDLAINGADPDTQHELSSLINAVMQSEIPEKAPLIRKFLESRVPAVQKKANQALGKLGLNN